MQPGRTKDPLQVERPEILFTAAFILIAAFSWVGILLAELGVFTGWRVFAGGSLIGAIAMAAAARDYRRLATAPERVSRRSWLIVALTVMTAGAVFAKPGEFIIEGADASVYLAVGRNIATTGGIASEDPVVALVPRELYGALFESPPRHPELVNRFPGGLRIGANGKVYPDFFHLLPVWIAIAVTAVGPYGGYFVNVVAAVLSVLAVWLIGRRVWSRAAGTVAAALLALNFGQVYYARLASSEMLAQFLFLSSVYFTIFAWDSRQRVAGACAGAAVGLAAFARIDLLLILVPLAALWLLLTPRGHHGQAWRWYAATLTMLAGHAAIHAATLSEFYTKRLLTDSWVQVQQRIDVVTLLAAMLVAGAVALAIRKMRPRVLLWVGLGAIAAGALVLSPAIVVNTSRLLSPVGLVVAVAGAAMILGRPADWRVLPILIPVIAHTLVMLAWSDTTTLPAEFRRAVPAILPGALLLIGYVVGTIAGGRGWPSAAVWVLACGLGGWFLLQTAPILATPPARGIHAQLAQLAAHIPPDAVVVADRSVPGHLALALQYSFGRSSLRLDDRPVGEDGIAPLVEQILASGRRAFVAVAPLVADTRNGFRRSDAAGFDMRESHATTLRYAVLVPVRRRFPRTLRSVEVPVTLYEITHRDVTRAVSRPLTIDIGGDDFAFLIGGFHAPEVSGSVRTRWTTDAAQIAIPRIGSEGAASGVIVVRLSGYRPAGMAPAVVRLAIDGIPVGTIPTTTPDLRDYRLDLPAPALARIQAGPTTLTISTDAFVPKTAGMSDDPRRLGIILDWVRIE